MLNVRLLNKTSRNGVVSAAGFPLLEELCIATTSHSYLTDKDLRDILFGSTKLRVLDLRGCSRISTSALAALPCPGEKRSFQRGLQDVQIQMIQNYLRVCCRLTLCLLAKYLADPNETFRK